MAQIYRLSVLDEKTGDIRELDPKDVSMIAVQRPRARSKEVFTMLFQNPLVDLARDRELWGRPRAVLDYLAAKIDYDNYMSVSQVEVARELGLNKQNVNAAIKLLIEKGILIPGPKVGHTRTYRLNSHWGYRGKLRHINEKRRADLQEIGDKALPPYARQEAKQQEEDA